METMERLREDWDDLAEIDAVWFNVPSRHLRGSSERFYESGTKQLRQKLDLLDRLRVSLKRDAALDFGCGIGRVTQALAGEFSLVYGVDISTKMIDIARARNRHGDRCQYLTHSRPDLSIFDTGQFDLVFSNNVLQHNPPDLIRVYLTEFVRTLRPNGVLLFQIPIRRAENHTNRRLTSLPRVHPRRVWNKLKGMLIGHSSSDRYYRLRRLGFSTRWLGRTLGLHPMIAMNHVDETVICETLAAGGSSVRHVEMYEYEDMTHAFFLCVKSA